MFEESYVIVKRIGPDTCNISGKGMSIVEAVGILIKNMLKDVVGDVLKNQQHTTEQEKEIKKLNNQIRALKGWVTRKSKGYN